MSRHSGGFEVRAPGAKAVRYPTRGRANKVAKQVRGGSVHRVGLPCPLALLLLPVLIPAALVRRWTA